MKKIFFLVLLGGLLFPLTGLADGSYLACPKAQPYYSGTLNRCCGEIGADGSCFSPTDPTTVHYRGGLVPCGLGKPLCKNAPFDQNGNCSSPGSPIMTGTREGMSCQLCHFFVMAKGIIDFFLLPPTGIIWIIAALLFTVGGARFLFSGGNPSSINQGKSIMISVVQGLVIILVAWVVVNTIFTLIGVADWTGLREGWFKINCSVLLPS